MADEWVIAPPRVMSGIQRRVIEEIRDKYLLHAGGDEDYRWLVEQITLDILHGWERAVAERGVHYTLTREELGKGWAAPLGGAPQ